MCNGAKATGHPYTADNDARLLIVLHRINIDTQLIFNSNYIFDIFRLHRCRILLMKARAALIQILLLRNDNLILLVFFSNAAFPIWEGKSSLSNCFLNRMQIVEFSQLGFNGFLILSINPCPESNALFHSSPLR